MIAYLGWGSLVWQPDGLPVRGQWLADGPTVCVEFLRQSGNGRLTLVMHAAASAVTSFWVEAGTDDEGDAKADLVFLCKSAQPPAQRPKYFVGLGGM